MSTLLRSTGVCVLLAMGLVLSLWAPSVADPLPPVYHPHRLQTIQPSITVVGTVITMPAHQQDGDVTFEVQTASQTFHAEIVCVHLRRRPPVLCRLYKPDSSPPPRRSGADHRSAGPRPPA